MSATKFTTYRYYRPCVFNEGANDVVPDNLGGITFHIEVDHRIGAISWSESICLSDENFSFENGRKFADDRWENDLITTTKFNPSKRLLEQIFDYYYARNEEGSIISERERTLIKTFFLYYARAQFHADLEVEMKQVSNSFF